MAFIIVSLRRIGRGTISFLFEVAFFFYLTLWDFSLVIVNNLTFKRRVGHVTPKGKPGEGGTWPEYIPPRQGDSRCACPALNAMANHGIIPRDGRNISFRELSAQVHETYNFAPTFCFYVLRYMAKILHRRDTYHQFNQGLPDGRLVAALIKAATGPPLKNVQSQPSAQDALPPNDSPYFDVAAHVAKATADFDLNRTFRAADLSRRLGERRREAQADNGQYSLARNHKIFGSSNASGFLTIFGGRVSDIYTFLTEERIPDGWESRVRDQMGLPMFTFNRTLYRVELGIEEEVNQPLNLL
ncbi:Cloroperoxidase [Russula compacta]|nr:Cloroperoxidase [Russula compacta]